MAHTFGNQGGLFLRAMVWWDHETDSLWSQPTGISILGEYAGVRLEAIPAAIEPWQAWLSAHPETLVLEDSDGILARTNQPSSPWSDVSDRQVAGVVLDAAARGYRVRDVEFSVLANDTLGGVPLMVYADPANGAVRVYVRAVGERVLSFTASNGVVRDDATGSVWHPTSGLAVEGPLSGEALQEIPFTSAFDWAWELHYPSTDFWPR